MEIAMVILGITLILEAYVSLIAMRIIKELDERYIAEIKLNINLDKKIKEQEEQNIKFAEVIEQIARESIEDENGI